MDDKSRFDILKNLLESIYAYVAEDYSIEKLEFHRDRIHEIVNEVCDEMKGEIQGLEL